MSLPSPEIAPDERLARFILQRSHFRADGTVKADAFIPHPHEELSVTRHSSLKEEEIWMHGRAVAAACGKILYGRADVSAADCLSQKLAVRADPTVSNPNHANITGWPKEKHAQKLIALELAAAAGVMVACRVA